MNTNPLTRIVVMKAALKECCVNLNDLPISAECQEALWVNAQASNLTAIDGQPFWEIKGKSSVLWMLPFDYAVPIGPVDEETGLLMRLDIEMPPAADREPMTVIEG